MERVGACVICLDEGQMGGIPIPEQHCSLAQRGPGQSLSHALYNERLLS